VYGSFAEILGPLRLYRALLCMYMALYIYLRRPVYIYLRISVLTYTLVRKVRVPTGKIMPRLPVPLRIYWALLHTYMALYIYLRRPL